MSLSIARAGGMLMVLTLAPAVAADPGMVVVTRFDGEPAIGQMAMGVLQLQVWQTLRMPEGGGPVQTSYYDDRVAPQSHADAEKRAVVDDVAFVLWGRAWDYRPGLALQPYLTIAADKLAEKGRQAAWTVRLSHDRSIVLGFPRLRYEFTPIVIENRLATTAGHLTTIPVFAHKGDSVPSGRLGGSFKAIEQDGEWSKVSVDGRNGWIRLPGLFGARSEVVSFVGGAIRAVRGDWPGVAELLKPLVKKDDVSTAVRRDSYLLLAAAAAQSKPENVLESIEWADKARKIAPLDLTTLKFACMARLAASAARKGTNHAVEARRLIFEASQLIPPGDPWFASAQPLLEELSGDLPMAAKH